MEICRILGKNNVIINIISHINLLRYVVYFEISNILIKISIINGNNIPRVINCDIFNFSEISLSFEIELKI
jgi:hypothetical protein